jgi:DUF177 domain-containing protein
VKITVSDIKAEPKHLAYVEDVGELNERLARGVRDFQVARGMQVAVDYYRAGLDIFFTGAVAGEVVGTCARCLEEYPFPLDRRFAVVLTPRVAALAAGGQLSVDELERSTYAGEEVDVTPLVYEEAILALPTRALCGEGCRGLCPRCGANLNQGPCRCAHAAESAAPSRAK